MEDRYIAVLETRWCWPWRNPGAQQYEQHRQPSADPNTNAASPHHHISANTLVVSDVEPGTRWKIDILRCWRHDGVGLGGTRAPNNTNSTVNPPPTPTPTRPHHTTTSRPTRLWSPMLSQGHDGRSIYCGVGDTMVLALAEPGRPTIRTAPSTLRRPQHQRGLTTPPHLGQHACGLRC